MVNINKQQFDANSKYGKCQSCKQHKNICYFTENIQPNYFNPILDLVIIKVPIKELCWDCVNELGRIN